MLFFIFIIGILYILLCSDNSNELKAIEIVKNTPTEDVISEYWANYYDAFNNYPIIDKAINNDLMYDVAGDMTRMYGWNAEKIKGDDYLVWYTFERYKDELGGEKICLGWKFQVNLHTEEVIAIDPK